MRKKGEPQLTLADLLEVLDGVMEMEGRMLVITTNYNMGKPGSSHFRDPPLISEESPLKSEAVLI